MPGRPNVIILLTDDKGYGDLSCHGNPVLKTPNLDRLHDQSVRLTDFHVAPMCTPTRGQLMTGKDALHNGASSVCAGRSFLRAASRRWPRSSPPTATAPRCSANGTSATATRTCRTSAASRRRSTTSAGASPRWPTSGRTTTSTAASPTTATLQQYPGYCTDVWFDLAMDWIKKGRQRQDKDQPFFLYLPTNAAHGPHWVPGKYKKPYEGSGPAAFFGMIANLDENLGRLDAFLARDRPGPRTPSSST